MSHSSRASNFASLRERLAQLNSEFFMLLSERRAVAMKIQEHKEETGRFPHYDPEREIEIFKLLQDEMKDLSLKELLAFSLIMEDQAMAMAPGSYPTWSSSCHLLEAPKDFVGMINPLLLKISHPELFSRLKLNSEFTFLKEF